MKSVRNWKLSVMLVLAMVVSQFFGGMSSVMAADHPQPAPVENSYEIDGVKYFNVGSEAFAKSPEQFLVDIMGTNTNVLRVTFLLWRAYLHVMFVPIIERLAARMDINLHPGCYLS